TRRPVDKTVLAAEVVEVERDVGQREQAELDEFREGPSAQGDPVEPVITHELVAAFGHQVDIVTALAEVVVLSGTATHDIVAADRAQTGEQVEDVAAVAEHAAVVALAVVEPVVALSAQDGFGPHRPVDDDVVAGTGEELTPVVGADHEVVPVAADQEIGAKPRP